TGLNATMGLLFPALMVPIIVTALATFPLGAVVMIGSVFGEGIFIWALLRGVCADAPGECWAPTTEADDPTPSGLERAIDGEPQSSQEVPG
ncbi:MAG TPA: hypothetical protein VL475_11890, partial [Planctomycetaceae bacterium]|nr:hypothetical protein [Planctomycetaceae bacterium]